MVRGMFVVRDISRSVVETFASPSIKLVSNWKGTFAWRRGDSLIPPTREPRRSVGYGAAVWSIYTRWMDGWMVDGWMTWRSTYGSPSRGKKEEGKGASRAFIRVAGARQEPGRPGRLRSRRTGRTLGASRVRELSSLYNCLPGQRIHHLP